MGHQYTGTDSYPTDFTIPDDLDDDKASSFNVAFEALGDRTTHLAARDVAQQAQIQSLIDGTQRNPALNFAAPVALSTGLAHVVYNAVRRCWVGGGGVKNIQESFTAGQQFNTGSTLAALTSSASILRIGVDDTTGDMVATTDNLNVFDGTGAGVWALTANPWGFLVNAGALTDIVHDGTGGHWVAYYADAFQSLFSSTNRTTWTNRGVNLPATGGGALSKGRLATDKLGRCVLARLAGPNVTEICTTNDGGATFVGAAAVTITHGFASPSSSSIRYCATAGLFVYVVGTTTASKLYTSPTGATWTLLRSFTGGGMMEVAFLGELWLASVYSGLLVESLDRGVTWRRTNYTADSLIASLASDDVGQFLMISANSSYASLRGGIGYGLFT